MTSTTTRTHQKESEIGQDKTGDIPDTTRPDSTRKGTQDNGPRHDQDIEGREDSISLPCLVLILPCD